MSDRLLSHLKSLVGERHPVTSPAHLRKTELYLIKEFRKLGLDVISHLFEAFGGTYHNVLGTVRAELQAPPLLIAAHFDTVERSPGADDNASGLAVLLEVARRVRTLSLGRPVRFIAFNLEEENLLGSRAYASSLKNAAQTILGAIVLECVGYARTDQGSQKTPPGVPVAVPSIGNFLAVVGNQASAALTTSLEQAMRSHVPVVPLVVPGNGQLLPDVRRSDHASFWHYGYPAVMLTDTANFRNPNYHRPTDTIETLDLGFMSRVTDAVTAAVVELAGREEGAVHQ